MVDFNILSIRGYGEKRDSYLYPALDEKGHFFVEAGDRAATAVAFSNVTIMRDDVTVFESEHGLDGKLFVTGSRIVLLCENYQSGNIWWVGGLVGALIASAASDALAKQRTSGTVLAGHIRYEWLLSVTAQSSKFLMGLVDETVVITYGSSERSTWLVTVTLRSSKGIAEMLCSEILRQYALFNQEPLNGSAQTAKAHQLPAVKATGSSASLYCTQCGGKIRERDAYCKHCGAKQTS